VSKGGSLATVNLLAATTTGKVFAWTSGSSQSSVCLYEFWKGEF
jgi:hypothetical protein